jgi:hypothetical protein
MKKETFVTIERFIFVFFAIFVTFMILQLLSEKQTLTEKVDKWDLLIQQYNSCDTFRQAQNRCLYETNGIDYEKCYWKAYEVE